MQAVLKAGTEIKSDAVDAEPPKYYAQLRVIE
jgi:hypothetical protein